MNDAEISITGLLDKINAVLINPLIIFLFVLANLIFIAGLLQFLLSPADSQIRERAKRHMLWGVIGVVIMISVYGILNILLSTFGIEATPYLNR